MKKDRQDINIFLVKHKNYELDISVEGNLEKFLEKHKNELNSADMQMFMFKAFVLVESILGAVEDEKKE
ncbi:hypothetical protein [Spiroplasma tabanidicola]|uniref:Uncharacterized protein n=1 Tax=Spiroplasma tabanidicola TaxID=324079 RepID=A0A6I6C976_9MOLU|nr:hypothetical protein [Spiroplasma tabanidicola]QGS51455.1 hypothetical protein STABA_v1c00880 [Spiroplasma tabanidicola]